MSALDWILVAIRWGHAVSAVAWVGGGIFYLMVLRPAVRRARGWPEETAKAVGSEFRSVVTTAIAVLLLTGAILTVSRLTEDAVTIPYIAVLVVKVSLAGYMFYVVRFLRRDSYSVSESPESGKWRRMRGRLTDPVALTVIGIAVIGLSDVLNALFEDALRG